MSSVDGVVFDADGTLFDTASLIYDAYCHLAGLHGYKQPTREQVAQEMGRPIPDIIEALFPGADAVAMLADNSDFVMKRAATVVAYDGLEHTLIELRDRGLSLGILTSGGDKIDHILSNHGLADYFSSVVHASRVSLYKPDPEGLLLAADEMEVAVGRIVMVGDTQPDIDVARNAGALASVGVTHGYSSRDALEGYGADYVVDTLPELIAVIDELRA